MTLFLIATGLTDDCDVQQGDCKLLVDCNAVGGSAKDCVWVCVSNVISLFSASAELFPFCLFEISSFLTF